MAKPVPGVIAQGAVVTYLLGLDPKTGQPVALGEFPHCPMWNAQPFISQCTAEIVCADMDGEYEDRCTREVGHHGPHVSHDRPGLPTMAWLETGTASGSRPTDG